MNWRVASLALAFASLSVLACGQREDDEDDDLDATQQPVIGGATTYERPEIGRMFFEWGTSCTATLVAPRVALTAAHCLKYRTHTARGDYGSLQFAPSENGPRSSFRLERFRSFGTDLGNGDIALVRLTAPVPSTIAEPAPMATSVPARGTALTIFGYGCNDSWELQTGSGIKRRYDYRYGDSTSRLCPGDSGGPVRVGGSGPVLFINSGRSGWGRDMFGNVPDYVTVLRNLTNAWASTPAEERGLRAEYFDTRSPSGEPKVVRVDPSIDFGWGSGAPDPVLPTNRFSARWTGTVVPRHSETYTLETLSDDGVRVWIDGRLLIDRWTTQSATTHRATVALTAGVAHALRVEHFDESGDATMRLFWSSRSQAREIVPQSQLRPALAPDTGVDAEYFASSDLSGAAVKRAEPRIDFDWGAGGPVAGWAAGDFSARWTTRVTPLYPERYTFSVVAEGGVRVWSGTTLLVDAWDATGSTERSVTLAGAFIPGRSLPLRVEYAARGARATARLSWSSPSQPKQVIGTEFFYR